MEIRKERYQRAVGWLQAVQQGDVVPLLPLPTDDQGNEAPAPGFLISSEPKQHYNW